MSLLSIAVGGIVGTVLMGVVQCIASGWPRRGWYVTAFLLLTLVALVASVLTMFAVRGASQ